jgi:hypothetical protein
VPHSQNSGTNHWCLYLSVSPKTSVQFDCQPSYRMNWLEGRHVAVKKSTFAGTNGPGDKGR